MYFMLFCFFMWSGNYIRILYVGWPSCKDSFFGLDSLCWVAIKESSCGLEGGGHYVRILYVEWPLHLHSLCGVAIM